MLFHTQYLGLKIKLSWQNVCRVYSKFWVWFPTLYKLVVHACSPSSWKVKTGGSGGQGHPWLRQDQPEIPEPVSSLSHSSIYLFTTSIHSFIHPLEILFCALHSPGLMVNIQNLSRTTQMLQASHSQPSRKVPKKRCPDAVSLHKRSPCQM